MPTRVSFRFPAVGLVLSAALLAAASGAQAQTRGGFAATARATATGDELGRQSNLWILEVTFKPVRMIKVDVTDPATGDKRRELVWYLVYRAVNRPLAEKFDTSDAKPVNASEPLPPELFVPEFTLVTEDNEGQKVYEDVVLPEAEAVIERREDQPLANPVEAVRAIPEPAAPDAGTAERIDGVAIWRGVDPETDNFRIFMTGFSNGYREVEGPDGNPLLLERTIVQEFWRPGDRVDENEREIRLKGQPEWIYRAAQPETADAGTPNPNDDTADEPAE